MILFGYWSRPGAGSFLKRSNANPVEVSAWLRWDGLYRHVLDQAGRSGDAEWANHVQESAHGVRCLRCGGSGLQLYAELLQVGTLSFAAWARLSDAAHRLDELRGVSPHTSRQRQTWERILHCLEPLSPSGPAAEPAEVVKRAVEVFTTMKAVAASAENED